MSRQSIFKVVVVTPDIVGDRMAGPGIRALHLARELARHFHTTLVAKGDNAPDVIEHNTPAARRAIREADVLVGQPARGFHIRRPGQRIIFDLFDPNVLELRELYGTQPDIRQRLHLLAEWTRLVAALETADVLMTAAPKQRRFYERVQSRDARWIQVPFGIDPEEARACAKPQDNLIVWGGGLWEWLDPATAVDATVRLNAEGVRCKLLFLGKARPNRAVVDRRRSERIDAIVARGGAHVSANADWIPYRERLSWLRAARIAIMLHRPTAEAEFSIRTRLFDAITAGVPVIATTGGFAADLVEAERLGLVVPPGDVAAVAGAMRRLLTDDAFHSSCVLNIERIRPRFAWDVVVRPLIEVISQWETSARQS
jgi:glycosyltransferase involved in cell wall biosynthesis